MEVYIECTYHHQTLADLEEEKEFLIHKIQEDKEDIKRREQNLEWLIQYMQGEGNTHLCAGCGKIVGHIRAMFISSPTFQGESGYIHGTVKTDNTCLNAWANKHGLKIKNLYSKESLATNMD